MTVSQAAVLTRIGEDAAFEIREYPLPTISQDDGLLHVDRCGVCGSDYRRVRRNRQAAEAAADRQDQRPLPAILGHEIVGTIAEVGSAAARAWRVREGDRVFVEASVPCQRCRQCVTGHSKYCRQRWSYGLSADLAEPPHLWGGFAQHIYLHPRAILHRLSL